MHTYMHISEEFEDAFLYGRLTVVLHAVNAPSSWPLLLVFPAPLQGLDDSKSMISTFLRTFAPRTPVLIPEKPPRWLSWNRVAFGMVTHRHYITEVKVIPTPEIDGDYERINWKLFRAAHLSFGEDPHIFRAIVGLNVYRIEALAKRPEGVLFPSGCEERGLSILG